MPLQKVVYPLVVNGGIDTKTDELLTPATANLILENNNFDKVGSNIKRNGFTKLTDNIRGGGTLSSKSPTFLFEHNNELIVGGSSGESELYSYNESDGEWVPKTGQPLPVFTFIDDKFGDEISSISPTIWELPSKNKRVIAYITHLVDSNYQTELKVIVQDYTTGEKKIIYSETRSLGLSSTRFFFDCKLAVYDQASPVVFLVYSQESGSSGTATYDIVCRSMDLSGTLIASTSIATGVTGLGFNCCLVGNKLFIACDTNSLTKTQNTLVNLSGGIDTQTQATTTAKKVAFTSFYAVKTYGSSIYVAFTTDNTTVASPICIYGVSTTNLTSTWAAFDVYRATTHTIGMLTIDIVNTGTELMLLYQEMIIPPDIDDAPSGARMSNCPTFSELINIAGRTESAKTNYLDSMVIASSLYSMDSTNDRYFIGQSIIPLFEKYFIFKISYTSSPNFILLGTFGVNGLAASYSHANSYHSATTGSFVLADVMLGQDSCYYFPASYVTRAIPKTTSGSSIYSVYIANAFVIRIDLNSEYMGVTAKIGGNTYLAGSMTKEYDGINLLEQNFADSNFIYPTVTANAGQAAGTYSYTGTYEYIDNNGQVHRSAPFTPRTITTATAKTVTIDCLFPKLDIADRGIYSLVSGAKDYRLILYRTLVNSPGVYYRIGKVESNYLYGTQNYTYEDTSLDAALVGAERLYTSGDILPSDCLSPIKYLIVANGRLFAISSEDENVILYSQPYLYGECANFSDALSLRVDAGLLSRSGKAMALATIDGKIIVLKDQSIAYFYGKGPDQAGNNNDYSDPAIISSDVGIKDIKSIVSIPDGILFKSNKGIYQLSQSLQLTYIGAPVEKYNSEKIIGTASLINKHTVLFMTASRILAYDYLQNKWGSWTNLGKAITTYNETPVYIGTDNRIYKLDDSVYKDDTNYYSLKMITPWIKMTGVQNFQRIYKVMILGKFKSAHTLTVKIYHDYDDTNVETHTINPVVTDKIYQYDLSPKYQKGQSFKIEIYDNCSTGTGQGFELTNLSLVMGQKTGVIKVENARQY